MSSPGAQRIKCQLNNEKQPSTQVYGNYEDKYNSKNLISKFLMSNFFQKFKKNLHIFADGSISTICEVGCAEGELLKTLHTIFPGAALSASDISEGEIAKARQNCHSISIDFSVQNAEDLQGYGDALFDLVICCEVLEHLPHPERGLRELFRISKNYVLVSVPNEPIWRMLNMTRGKYLRDFGNTPGHLNHWNIIQFPQFLTSYPGCSIIQRSYPFPWQMVLLKKH
jgi:2-polyprenyl-3-methyl-5-hydroxy-6-metoxy-1,4-benzoquinol methylase